MITGSMNLNNLTDAQLVQVMEAKTANEGKLFFNPAEVQESQSGSQSINNRVVVS